MKRNGRTGENCIFVFVLMAERNSPSTFFCRMLAIHDEAGQLVAVDANIKDSETHCLEHHFQGVSLHLGGLEDGEIWSQYTAGKLRGVMEVSENGVRD